jgi:DNA-directed RNA polymerase subunit F
LAMTFIPSIIKGRLDMTFAQNLLSNFGFRNKKYRTPIEAEINKEYWQYNPPGKRTDSSKEKSEVLNEVRKLKLNGQLEEAEKLYTESQDKGLLGKKDYDDFLKDLDKGEYVNKFKQLPAEVQRELITDMEQPEIEKYFEGMKLEVRKDFYDTMPEGVKTLYYPDTFRKKSEKIIEKQSESYKYMDAMSKTNEGEKPKEVRRPKSTKPKSKKPYEKKY